MNMNVDLPFFASSVPPTASAHHQPSLTDDSFASASSLFHFSSSAADPPPPPPRFPSFASGGPLDSLHATDSLLVQQTQQQPPPSCWLLQNAHLLPFLTNLVGGTSSPPAAIPNPPTDHHPLSINNNNHPLPLHHFPPTLHHIHPSSSSVKDEAAPPSCFLHPDILHPSAITSSPYYPRLHDLDDFSSSSVAPSALSAAAASAALRLSQLQHGSLDLEEQYLAELQAMLRSEYGVNLSMSQILDVAYDNLPALTPALGDYYHGVAEPQQPQPHDMHLHQLLQQQPQPSEEVHNPIRDSSTASSSDVLGTSMVEASLHDCRRPVILDYTAGGNKMAIPGHQKASLSEASSSALTENGEQTSIRQKLLPPALVSTTASAESHELVAAEGPASKRIKLQGITLEQVMAAEQQCLQAGPATTAEKSSKRGMHSETAAVDPSWATAKPRSSPPTIAVTAVAASTDHDQNQKSIAAALINDRASVVEAKAKPSSSSEKRVVSASMIASYSSVEPQSIAARNRRKRIREKTESLGQLIPGATRLDTAAMFDLAIKYVHFLQAQMVCLEREAEQKHTTNMSNGGGGNCVSTAGVGGSPAETTSLGSRALMHRLLSSPDIQHFLAREGYCLVSHGLAHSLAFSRQSSV